MIKLENFFNFLKKREISFFTGVPDSILKEFSIYIEHKKIKHIQATNEGSAVALASGYYLSNKKIPAIYLQNSGLGNAINPLISILHKKVYSIPSLLIIGWRGAPGLKDEPQHLTKGKITKNLLNLAGIKYCIINDEKSLKKLSNLINYSKKNNVPVACLIKKNTFIKNKKYFIDKNKNYGNLKRDIIIKELLKKVRNTKIISSTGYISRELFRLSSNKQKKKQFLCCGRYGSLLNDCIGIFIVFKKTSFMFRR